MWEAFTEWFFSLGDQYGVNPIIFGSIYVGAIPFFTLSVGWLVRNLRRKFARGFKDQCARHAGFGAPRSQHVDHR